MKFLILAVFGVCLVSTLVHGCPKTKVDVVILLENSQQIIAVDFEVIKTYATQQADKIFEKMPEARIAAYTLDLAKPTKGFDFTNKAGFKTGIAALTYDSSESTVDIGNGLEFARGKLNGAANGADKFIIYVGTGKTINKATLYDQSAKAVNDKIRVFAGYLGKPALQEYLNMEKMANYWYGYTQPINQDHFFQNDIHNQLVELCHKEPGDACQNEVDMVVMIEDSAHVTEHEFYSMRDNAAALIDALNLRVHSRVAAVAFGQKTQGFGLDYYTLKRNIRDGIKRLTYNGDGNANMGLAMAEARKILNEDSNGFQKMIVYWGVGKTTDQNQFNTEVEAAKNEGIKMFVVYQGTPTGTEMANLKLMTSPYGLRLQPFSRSFVNVRVSEALKPGCPECSKPPLDVAILLDNSQSITSQGYDKMKELVKKFVGKFSIGTKENDVRVSLVVYGDDVNYNQSTPLNKYSTLSDLRKHIDSLTFQSSKTQSVTQAIQFVETSILNNVRPRSYSVMVIVANALFSSDTTTAIAEAKKARGKFIKTYTVGFETFDDTFSKVAGDRWYAVDARGVSTDSTKMDAVASRLAHRVCFAGNQAKDL